VRTQLGGHDDTGSMSMTPIKTTYVDRPEVSETLVDTVQMTTFHENLCAWSCA